MCVWVGDHSEKGGAQGEVYIYMCTFIHREDEVVNEHTCMYACAYILAWVYILCACYLCTVYVYMTLYYDLYTMYIHVHVQCICVRYVTCTCVRTFRSRLCITSTHTKHLDISRQYHLYLLSLPPSPLSSPPLPPSLPPPSATHTVISQCQLMWTGRKN